MRSDNIKKGIAKTPHRSLLMAAGVSKKNIKSPYIGIASSFTDLVPGHIGMRDLERQIEKGIHTGGGQAFIFGVPAVCDGIAMGHDGMRYSLPSRDLIADCIETMANAHQLDGLVLLSNCDKITPGMLIAAARLNIPCIIVYHMREIVSIYNVAGNMPPEKPDGFRISVYCAPIPRGIIFQNGKVSRIGIPDRFTEICKFRRIAFRGACRFADIRTGEKSRQGNGRDKPHFPVFHGDGKL